jgi:hypothetical protein
MAYLFVDGAYLDREVRSMGPDVCVNEIPQIDYATIFSSFDKTFYFDCSDHSEACEKKFGELRMIPRCHVVLGELVSEGKRRRQKGVDLLIGLKMLRFARERVTSRMMLLAGDRDFEPLVKELVDMGVHVTVWCGKTPAKELLWAADDRTTLDVFTWNGIDQSFRDRYIPSIGWYHRMEPPTDWTRVGTFELRGEEAWLYRNAEHKHILVHPQKEGPLAGYRTWVLRSRDHLLKVVSKQLGEELKAL